MRFNFSSPSNMNRVIDKYLGVGYGDREGKICPFSTPLPCLIEQTPVRKKIKDILIYVTKKKSNTYFSFF